MSFHFRRILTLAALGFAAAFIQTASVVRADDFLAADGVAGSSELLGGEIRLFASSQFQIGIGYGIFPVYVNL